MNDKGARASAARALGVQLSKLEARNGTELDRAFATAARERVDAVFVLTSPMAVQQRGRLVSLATKHRLPTMYAMRIFVEAGGLLAYGPDLLDLYALRRAELRRIRFHDLRHTYTSLLIAHGAHPKYIQAQLDHASIQTTLDCYGHLMPQLHQAEALKLDQLVFGQQPAPAVRRLQAVRMGGPAGGSKMGAENTKGLAT